MKRIKAVSVNMSPFTRTLWIIANVPQEDYLKWCKKYFHVTMDVEPCSGRYNGFEKGSVVYHAIWLERYRGRTDEIGLLAHELFHAAMAAWREVRSEVTEDTEELFAAYFQMLLVCSMADLKGQGFR